MSIFWGLEHYSPPDEGVAVTIGVFDGVHRGHQALLRRLLEVGGEMGIPTTAVTMDRHPLEIVSPENAPLLLCSSRDRVERISRSGVNRVVVLTFDEALALIDARKFVHDVLVEHLGARALVVGESFRFGRGREGDPELLCRMGEDLGFSVEVVPPLVVDGHAVSSSRLRRVLERGDVRLAARLLGCCYKVTGSVVHGDERGRQIGFPTANVDVPDWRLVPGNGVYAVNTRFNGVLLRGAANVGVRPTAGGGPRTLEVHLIGYEGTLYGHDVEVHFLDRIRDERRFDSMDDLKQQIRLDIQKALDVPDCAECMEADTGASAVLL